VGVGSNPTSDKDFLIQGNRFFEIYLERLGSDFRGSEFVSDLLPWKFFDFFLFEFSHLECPDNDSRYIRRSERVSLTFSKIPAHLLDGFSGKAEQLGG
jgi:hypothetical protein